MRIAAVLGGAAGGFDELASLGAVAAVYAVNDAAAEYPGPLAAFVTLHPEKLPMWLRKRRAAGYPEPAETVAHEAAGTVSRVADYRWPGMTGSGSSGLYAAKVALEADPDWRVVLCGVPMDPEKTHYAESTFREDSHSFRAAWTFALPYLRERVRSLSGWTAGLLGQPTPEWLARGEPQPAERF